MASLQTVSYDLRRTVRNQEQASNRKFAHRPRPSHVSHRSNIPLLWNLVGGGHPPPWLTVALPSQPAQRLPFPSLRARAAPAAPPEAPQLLQPTQAWPHLHSQCAHCLITWHPCTFHHLRSLSRPPWDMGRLVTNTKLPGSPHGVRRRNV